MLAEKLVEYALPKAEGRVIRDVRAGLGYTCVMLEDGASGLAYTFRNEMGEGCGVLGEAGKLIGKAARDIIPWVRHGHRLKAAIGLAALNAVVNNEPGLDWETGNVISAIELGESDTFGMVGDFPPLQMSVGQKTRQIYVFEINPPEGSGLYSEKEIPLLLPKCDVVVITATSIINHTIDGVLPHCASARTVCLVGASTPLCPEVFRHYNVTLLAGSQVLNSEKALEIVSQGGGTMALKSATRQVLVKVGS